MILHPRAVALKVKLDTMPGAVASTAMTRGRAPRPISIGYSLFGKTLAIIWLGENDPYVVLKCDPHLIEVLKETYAGVGHRTHLDRRHWIAINLDGDVPEAQVERLVEQSYALVRGSLTRKQQAELAVAS